MCDHINLTIHTHTTTTDAVPTAYAVHAARGERYRGEPDVDCHHVDVLEGSHARLPARMRRCVHRGGLQPIMLSRAESC